MPQVTTIIWTTPLKRLHHAPGYSHDRDNTAKTIEPYHTLQSTCSKRCDSRPGHSATPPPPTQQLAIQQSCMKVLAATPPLAPGQYVSPSRRFNSFDQGVTLRVEGFKQQSCLRLLQKQSINSDSVTLLSSTRVQGYVWVEVVAECLGVQHLLLTRSRDPWLNFDSTRERDGGWGDAETETDRQTDRQTDTEREID